MKMEARMPGSAALSRHSAGFGSWVGLIFPYYSPIHLFWCGNVSLVIIDLAVYELFYDFSVLKKRFVAKSLL